jgi:hypothetical protein
MLPAARRSDAGQEDPVSEPSASTSTQTGDQRTIAVTLAAPSKEDQRGEATLLELTAKERFAKVRVPVIALGVICVLGMWPGPHLVLTLPAGIVAFIIFRYAMARGTFLTRLTGPCPTCGEEIEISEQPADFPIVFNCPHCRRRMDINPAGGAA